MDKRLDSELGWSVYAAVTVPKMTKQRKLLSEHKECWNDILEFT